MAVGQTLIELSGQGASQDKGGSLLLLRQGPCIVRHVVVQIVGVGAVVFFLEKGIQSGLDFGLELHGDVGVFALTHALQTLRPLVQRMIPQASQGAQGSNNQNRDKQESPDHGSYL
ncbi:MAG: hypothetical protein HQ515_26035 [Phycisphaeraceae bacterium]|nr:hypothetical protein [Phycisphaeraceae bacterium]